MSYEIEKPSGTRGVRLIESSLNRIGSDVLRRVVVENAGHFLQLEQPQRVADEVIGFLNG